MLTITPPMRLTPHTLLKLKGTQVVILIKKNVSQYKLKVEIFHNIIHK
jgi:hypothetical protein